MVHSNYTVHINESVIEVLKKLDNLPTTQTVFVLDDNQKVLGTITDGNIRRGLIKGLDLNSSLEKYLHRDFKFLIQGEHNFEKLGEVRALKLKAVPLLDSKGKLLKIYDFSIVKSILPIDAVLMAGGKGKRLRPLTDKVPKPLLKVGNKEIIAYNFDRLHQYGINKQYITVNYLADQIENFCEDYNKDINISVIRESEFLGTAGALSLIPEFKNDVILLMNSDLLTNIDYEDFYKTFISSEADMMVASVPYDVNLPYAIFETNNDEVKSFKEKPSYTYYANAGIYLLKKELLSLVPKQKVFNATDLMDKVVAERKKLIHYPILSYWLDIGKHEDFDKAQKDIAHIDFD